MANMVHLVINRKIILLLLLLFLSIKTIAQQKIDKNVSFSYIEKGKTTYMNLDNFISRYSFDDITIKDINCLSGSGIFIFEVSPQSKIISIKVEGNLPIEIVEAIKKRILLTENYWSFNNHKKKRKENMKFFFPYYFTVDFTIDCHSDYNESLKWIQEILDGQKIKAMGNNRFLITPQFGSIAK